VNLVFNQFDMPLAQDPLGLKEGYINPTAAGTNAVANLTRKIVSQNQLGGSATYTLNQGQSITTRAYYGTRENLQYQSSALWTGLNRAYYGLGIQYNAKTTWSDIPVDWAAGYEFDRSIERRQAGYSPKGVKGKDPSKDPSIAKELSRDEDNQAENSDVFFQATAHVSDQVDVVGGLRASSVRFVSTDYWINAGSPDGSGGASFSAANPIVGLTYFAKENLNFYANYGQGFETPTLAEVAYKGASAAAVFNPDLNASTSQHYEIGAKWAPNRNSRVDLSAFQIDSTNEIVVLAGGSGPTSYQNTPGTSRVGWDLSASTLLNRHWSASLAASMIDATYSKEFVPPTGKVAAGNKIPGIPQTSVFSELAWTSEPAQSGAKKPLLGTRLSAELVQAGRIYANDKNDFSANGHTIINLSASQRWAMDKAAVTLYARLNNANDERYDGSVIVNQTSAGYFEPGLPRNWVLGVSISAPL
jgi:iron complex outermembrane receptor protein